jgi:hypothetical protein
MELTYRLTRDDLRHFDKLAKARITSQAKRHLGGKGAMIMFAVASVVVTVLVLESLLRIGIIDLRANITAGLGYIWGVWTMTLGGKIWLRLHRADRLTDGNLTMDELRLRIDGDGVHACTQTGTETYYWRAFTDVSEHADHIVLWLDHCRGVIVPARAVASEETRRELLNFAREHIAPAQA